MEEVGLRKVWMNSKVEIIILNRQYRKTNTKDNATTYKYNAQCPTLDVFTRCSRYMSSSPCLSTKQTSLRKSEQGSLDLLLPESTR